MLPSRGRREDREAGPAPLTLRRATPRLHQTLAGYTLSRRCLPIVLIVASMAATAAVCSRLVARAASAPGKRRGHCCPADTEIGPVSPREPQQPLFTGASSTAHGAAAATPPGASTGAEGATAAASHEVRAGRPDVDALVLAAAAGLEAHGLVVAACGPAALVEAAWKAVAAARKEHHRVRIEFSGSDSRW